MLEARELMKLGRLSGEDLAISLWWSSLDAKLSVYGIMDLVADMDTDTKRAMRLNNFGIPINFFCFYCILLL